MEQSIPISQPQVGARRISLVAAGGRVARRKAVSTAMTGLLGGAALVGVVVLALILGYVIVRGLPAISVEFFFERPQPIGEVGRRRRAGAVRLDLYDAGRQPPGDPDRHRHGHLPVRVRPRPVRRRGALLPSSSWPARRRSSSASSSGPGWSSASWATSPAWPAALALGDHHDPDRLPDGRGGAAAGADGAARGVAGARRADVADDPQGRRCRRRGPASSPASCWAWRAPAARPRRC